MKYFCDCGNEAVIEIIRILPYDSDIFLCEECWKEYIIATYEFLYAPIKQEEDK